MKWDLAERIPVSAMRNAILCSMVAVLSSACASFQRPISGRSWDQTVDAEQEQQEIRRETSAFGDE